MHFERVYKKIIEAIDMPPPAIVLNIPNQANANSSSFYNAQKVLDTVVACVILEAGGEGKAGMEAINEVLQNRAKFKYKAVTFDTMAKIATEPKQFSCFNAGVDNAIAKAKKHPKWKEAENIVKAPVTSHVNGSRFYHTINLKRPGWAQTFLNKGAQRVTLGHHVFYTNVKGY